MPSVEDATEARATAHISTVSTFRLWVSITWSLSQDVSIRNGEMSMLRVIYRAIPSPLRLYHASRSAIVCSMSSFSSSETGEDGDVQRDGAAVAEDTSRLNSLEAAEELR